MPGDVLKPFRWNADKNRQLQAERRVRFEEVLQAIQNNQLLDIIQHPNPKYYPNQRVFIVKMNQYVYLVPFVETDTEVFLKTIIPSRKFKRQYLGD
ncbi:MAG: toxin [Cyanobacteria bacterium P01_D01_bin.128]